MEIYGVLALLGMCIVILALAWFNGANDVAKGIATLVGSGNTAPRRAVLWGSLWTVLGGFAAMVWGIALVDTFSHGLLAPGFSADLIYLASAVLGATGWVMLATRRGLPVSTTHALLGGIIGAALVVVGPSGLRASAIASKAMLPLLASPLVAIILCWALLLLGKTIARRVPAWRPGCCPQEEWRKNPFICDPSRPMPEEPKRHYIERLLSLLHWFSSGATSFARGLNDTPKIAAFLFLGLSLFPGVMAVTLPINLPIMAVAIAMGLGSLWGGYRVLSVMAHHVAPLDQRNAVVANVTTSSLVLLASPLGLPMSTTHVSTGALLGVRLGERGAPPEKDAIKMILLGWLVTLPVAATLAAAGGWLLRAL